MGFMKTYLCKMASSPDLTHSTHLYLGANYHVGVIWSRYLYKELKMIFFNITKGFIENDNLSFCNEKCKANYMHLLYNDLKSFRIDSNIGLQLIILRDHGQGNCLSIDSTCVFLILVSSELWSLLRCQFLMLRPITKYESLLMHLLNVQSLIIEELALKMPE